MSEGRRKFTTGAKEDDEYMSKRNRWKAHVAVETRADFTVELVPRGGEGASKQR